MKELQINEFRFEITCDKVSEILCTVGVLTIFAHNVASMRMDRFRVEYENLRPDKIHSKIIKLISRRVLHGYICSYLV